MKNHEAATGAAATIAVKHRFDATPERVFDAWLDPAKARKFLYATPSGEMVRCEIDARVGGTYEIVERRDGEDVAHTGEYLEIDRPHRLVFTLSVLQYSPDVDRVTIVIVPAGAGCELTLTHELAPEWAAQTEKGWTDIFNTLAARIAHGEA
jgi:uncharacterized protein YndB with AHSA1/START domain